MNYLIILVLLIVFFATIGIRFIINASLFISGIGKTAVQETGQDDDILLAPELYDIPDATNSANLKISGAAPAESLVILYVNDEEQDRFNVDEDSFESTLSLEEGKNTVYAQTENTKGDRTKDSETFVVYYISKKPELSIDAPGDGTKTNDTEIIVSGTVSKDASVKINLAPVVVGPDGKFSGSVRLREGENLIKVSAQDFAGNEIIKEIKVIFEKDG